MGVTGVTQATANRGAKRPATKIWELRLTGWCDVIRFLAATDWLAHVLYCPTMLGRRCVRARWHHNIHLIPGWLLAWVCDRYDLALGVTPDELRRTA
jgi:hypothetical protein